MPVLVFAERLPPQFVEGGLCLAWAGALLGPRRLVPGAGGRRAQAESSELAHASDHGLAVPGRLTQAEAFLGRSLLHVVQSPYVGGRLFILARRPFSSP